MAQVVPEQRHYGDALGERSAIPQRLRELWSALRQPAIWRPCAFIFLLNATPATGAGAPPETPRVCGARVAVVERPTGYVTNS